MIVATVVLVAACGQAGKQTPIDLQPKANHALKDSFGFDPADGNHLAELEPGDDTLHGVRFKIEAKCLALRTWTAPAPGAKKAAAPTLTRIDGIEIGREFAKLHVLHAARNYQEFGRTVGWYVLKYEDRTEAKLPMVTGTDVCDWWSPPEGVKPAPKNAAVHWEGSNPNIKRHFGGVMKLQLQRSSFANPHPAKEVKSIDYASSDAFPQTGLMCVAMTVEK